MKTALIRSWPTRLSTSSISACRHIFTARTPLDQRTIDDVLAGVDRARSGYEGMFAAISDSLAGRGGRDVTLADGRRSIEFATAVYHAARAGQPETLPLDSLHPLYNGWIP